MRTSKLINSSDFSSRDILKEERDFWIIDELILVSYSKLLAKFSVGATVRVGFDVINL